MNVKKLNEERRDRRSKAEIKTEKGKEEANTKCNFTNFLFQFVS